MDTSQFIRDDLFIFVRRPAHLVVEGASSKVQVVPLEAPSVRVRVLITWEAAALDGG